MNLETSSWCSSVFIIISPELHQDRFMFKLLFWRAHIKEINKWSHAVFKDLLSQKSVDQSEQTNNKVNY